MTVCIAALFRWFYAKGTIGNAEPVVGSAVLATSDRMLTLGDTEFEASRWKAGLITKRSLVLAADQIAVHSEVVRKTQRHFANNQLAPPETVAESYAEFMTDWKARNAARVYLEPHGLTIQSFLDRQTSLSEYFVADKTSKVENFCVPAQALIVGCSDPLAADIYQIGGDCIASCLTDKGFAAIGLGATHALSHYMLTRYGWHEKRFAEALYAIWSAKKKAEAAPGVGKVTDIWLITQLGIEPIKPETMNLLHLVYESAEYNRSETDRRAVEELENLINITATPPPPPASS